MSPIDWFQSLNPIQVMGHWVAAEDRGALLSVNLWLLRDFPEQRGARESDQSHVSLFKNGETHGQHTVYRHIVLVHKMAAGEANESTMGDVQPRLDLNSQAIDKSKLHVIQLDYM